MEVALKPETTSEVNPRNSLWTAHMTAQTLSDLSHRVVRRVRNHETFMVHSPINQQELGLLPLCGMADVEEALHRAKLAQRAWETVPVKERVAVLSRYHDLVLAHKEALLDVMQLETGKARIHAFEEIFDVALNARYYANVAPDLLAPSARNGAIPFITETTEYHHPVGVVGIIAPWNYPLTLAISDALPAIVAGNAVILKPAEQTSFTALLGLELLIKAGLPTDVFQVVTGTGPDIGPALIAGSDFLMFTGSTATGRKVAAQAGEYLIKCSMELGGKNPMVVLEDADVAAAAAGAVRGSFGNAGQLCISFERIYVARSIYNDFKKAFIQKTEALRLGTDFNHEVEMGSLISQMQLDKVHAHVKDAVHKGATVLTGGKPRIDLGPYFYAPTILEGVTPEMHLFREETFGPVVALYPFDTEHEAVDLANDTVYGLNAAVWSRNTSRAVTIARKIKAGTVNVNETYGAAWASLDAPMGGMKRSGIGRRHGAEGLLKYTESQTVAVQRLTPIAKPDFLSGSQFADVMTMAAKVFKWLPGIK
ncbi:MAG: succinate-semialdehyde dehydrogenase (NADP(+)) [Bacteroidetes Order II. Incertae sedis bacterium]|nr:succinate-semialdehyde dehydrogenase (NADP(+)) [Bacteroidetes Order II. bacterium]